MQMSNLSQSGHTPEKLASENNSLKLNHHIITY